MADITSSEGGAASKHTNKKRRSRKRSLRVDLTPMVDLAFLLIAFFMLTTEMGKAHALELDKRLPQIQEPVSECRVLNILMDSFNRAYTYEGEDMDKMRMVRFDKADDLRALIMDKARRVRAECGFDKTGHPYEIICLVKMLPGSNYRNLVNIMDEMKITGTRLNSLQEPSPEEIAAIRQQPV